MGTDVISKVFERTGASDYYTDAWDKHAFTRRQWLDFRKEHKLKIPKTPLDKMCVDRQHHVGKYKNNR